VGELKPANQIVNPQDGGAAAGGAAAGGAAAGGAAAGGAAAGGSLGSASSSCGLSTDCSPEEFSVHLFSGKENIDGPKMCINGN